MERIVVFMVLFGVVWVPPHHAENYWKSWSYNSCCVCGLRDPSVPDGESMAFSQTTCTECPVSEAMPPVIVMLVTVCSLIES